MFEVGQHVRIRERIWEVIDDHASGTSGDHVLQVRPIRDTQSHRRLDTESGNGYNKDTFTFIYRPGTEIAEPGAGGIERITLLPSPELTWSPITSTSRWERLHTAHRLSISYNPDCLLSLARSRLIIEPYQLDPVLRVMRAPRQRFLLAEDVGLGKTIEAGLIMMEMIARGRADRILIVVPAALQDQWNDEMYDKFGFSFQIIDNEELRGNILPGLPPGANPWAYRNRVITSVDFAKQEQLLRALKNTHWDLIVVDEAHYLSESGTALNVSRSVRSRFGEELARLSDHLLLLTATPHNGYSQGFYSLLRLLDDARFPSPTALDRRVVEEVVIRRTKNDILNRDGSQKFKQREVRHITVSIKQSGLQLERALYRELHKYANSQYKLARSNANEKVIIGFAMTLLKKRFISSPHALRESLKTRKEKLEGEQVELDKKARAIQKERRGMPMTDREVKQMLEIAMAQTVSRDKASLEKEIAWVERILKIAEEITPDKDAKARILKEELDRLCFHETEPRRVIVFTEYKDTLEYLYEYLTERGYDGRIVRLHGEMNRPQRLIAEQQFHDEKTLLMLATDAASEGLNFQRDCWTVIHNELPWNPNRLEQRNGRVDRYGQERKPDIVNMVLDGTLESHILQRLAEKLDNIRKELGQVSDVLNLANQLHLEELDVRLMERAYDLGDDPEQTAMEEMIAQVDAELESQIQQVRQQQREWLATMNISHVFGSKQYQEVDRSWQQTEKQLPTNKQIEEFALSVLRERGGKAESHKSRQGVWHLTIPTSLQRTGVKEVYEQATFLSDVARGDTERRSSPNYLEYISVGHPLLEGMVATVKADAREAGGRLAGRMSPRVLPANQGGMLFTFLGRWQDGRGVVVAEEIMPFFLPLEPEYISANDSTQMGQHLLGQDPLPRNAPQALLEERYRPHWEEFSQRVKTLANQYSEHYADKVKSQRLPQLQQLEQDIESWAVARLAWEKQQIELRARERNRKQTTLFNFHANEGAEARAKNELARSKKAIDNHKQERIQEIIRMGQVVAMVPEMIGALVIVPEKEC